MKRKEKNTNAKEENRMKNVSAFGMRARLSSFGIPESSHRQNMFPIDAKMGSATINRCR